MSLTRTQNKFSKGIDDKADDTAVTVDESGNVGIGTDSPVFSLDVQSSNGTMRNRSSTDTAVIRNQSAGGNYTKFETSNSGQIDVKQNETARLTIDSTGNVGIGMDPLRSTAKEQLAEWKSQFDARLKAEPKADKKAVTLEITDDAFEVLPTEDKLAEWMETRGAGDKLQVNGNISASGAVSADGGLIVNNSFFKFNSIDSRNGVALGSANGFLLLNNAFEWFEPSVAGKCSIGHPGNEFKNAHFSGTVSAGQITMFDQGIYRSGYSGIWFSPSAWSPADGSGNSNDATTNLGSGAHQFKNGYFSDDVWINGVPATTTRDLIETLSTLRNATKDETTLEGLRDAIGNAVGGLIEKFEAMQSAATQEIDLDG